MTKNCHNYYGSFSHDFPMVFQLSASRILAAGHPQPGTLRWTSEQSQPWSLDIRNLDIRNLDIRAGQRKS